MIRLALPSDTGPCPIAIAAELMRPIRPLSGRPPHPPLPITAPRIAGGSDPLCMEVGRTDRRLHIVAFALDGAGELTAGRGPAYQAKASVGRVIAHCEAAA